ncbi:hypothetical protein L218DRAFT_991430 [Marasmius fiardii PR-910]|nr:hypothetical protein L218DRAFT_991430 [Marasmius fiardii PR-910]
MFSIIPRIGFLVLLLQSCAGLEIDIPPSIFVEKVTTFHWECDTTDVDQGLSGAFAALLISPPEPPENFSCLNLEAAGDQDTLTKLVQSYSVHLVPSGTKAGVFLLTPKSQGIHVICSYGNVSVNSSVNVTATILGRMTATANTTIPSSATFSTLSTANSGMQNGTNHWKGDRQKHHDTAALVSGVMGVVLLIAIILAIIFYRRLRYQRKLNQLQKEHLLLHQRPPSSLFLSSNTATRTMVESDLPNVAPVSTLKRRWENPAGFEESMSVQKGYQFSTGPHSSLSPPSYSPALSNEPEVLSGVSKRYPADSEKQQA